MMKKTFLHIIIPSIALTVLFYPVEPAAQDKTAQLYSAYDLKAERIHLVNDAVKITWKMNQSHTGDFVLGRSEKELNQENDVLNARLIGTFNSSQEGIIIDRGLQQGKKYYYVIITKADLFNRNIKLYNDVNITVVPVSLFAEPSPVESLKGEIHESSSIRLSWNNTKKDLKYNIYRSKSMISGRADLEVAEKISSVQGDTYTDRNVPDYGTYFYAITITDKNDIEYFTPSANNNYTISGIYIKGRTLTTPLNTGAFLGQNNTIIVKWEQGHSLTGKTIAGYEIYRSEEIIDSQLKLKFAKLLHITDAAATMYTDMEAGPGKYYYAVFARYNDGTVDIDFASASNYTSYPVMITTAFRITAMEAGMAEGKIIIKWNYTGNSGNEAITIFRTSKPAEDSGMLMPDAVIATDSIKTGVYTTSAPAKGIYYYGLYIKNENQIVQFKQGINISPSPIGYGEEEKKEETAAEGKKEIIPEEEELETGKDTAIKKKTEPEKEKKEKPGRTGECTHELDYIIKNYFYREQYRASAKELNIFISVTDNDYDKAKARLYLARTYIELDEFGKSIKLLNLEDVRQYFPEEAEFWCEFATARLK